ncbi:MAG: glycoside hydrolase family 2 TIM barrel-domain containing protein [Luteolibacter sp.]|jgi:beta-galactosidase|nr:glycoside hydrolase family 2 TIM barrel-domain containing protein [Luteolibacter sp.]
MIPRLLLLLIPVSFLTLAFVNAAPGPAIINGNFSEKSTNGNVPGWRLSAGATVENDDRKALVLRSTTPGSASASQDLVCAPEWGVLRFRYRVSVPAITPGSASWHNARIALSIADGGGGVTHTVAGEWSAPTAGWISGEKLVNLPAGTQRIGISPAIFNASGEMRVAELQVELAARRGEGMDAPPAQGERPIWGKEPVEKHGPHREIVCLNGLWRFMPAAGPAVSKPPKAGWGWLRVPGSWRSGPLPAPTRGGGPMWEGFNGESPAAWYQRSLSIPANWSGRAIILDLRRISTDALVLIDGREAGSVSWPGGEVDLTNSVRPGQTHNLSIKVVATANQQEVTRIMGTGEGQAVQEKMFLQTRGIIGDVLLVKRPKGARLTGCAVQTTVKPPSADGKIPAQGDTFTLVVDYTGLPSAGELTLSAVARDTRGAEARRFTAKVRASAGDGSVSASWKWDNPALWDIQQPNLYTLDLVLQGAGVNDSLRETFGFREFRIDGKKFLLNGAEIRLRPAPIHAENSIGGVPELMDNALDGLRWAGFNTTELWPWDRDERGTWEFDDLWCQEADRRGFLMIVPALAYPSGLDDAWNNPATGPPWAKKMAPLLKRLRNHPSAIMWVTGTNRFGNGQDQNPVNIGSRTRAWTNHNSWRHGAEGGLKAMRWIKEVDPTRPVFMHAGGPVGDVYTSNNYLCLIPLQEREEWLSRWAQDGDMPVMMVEFGTPLYTTFHRGRRGYGQASTSEPLYTEFCAIYQGAEAYRLESPAYRATVSSTFEKDMLWKSWHSIPIPEMHEGFNQLQALFQRNTWRSWRTWGITGGMIPWSNGHGWSRGTEGGSAGETPPPLDALPAFKPGQRGAWKPEAPRNLTRYFRPEGMPLNAAGKALVASNQETLAWLAGAPDFVDKTHHVRAGASLNKQAVIINDSRNPLKWSLTCHAELDGVTLIQGEDEGEIGPASTSFLPLIVKIPDTLKQDRTDGVIHLTCTIGDAKHEDSFPFTAFRANTGSATPPTPVSLLDPLGETKKLLESLNLPTVEWDQKTTTNLVVIGRNAFAKGGVNPDIVRDHLNSGGRALMMAQDPQWLRDHVGLRVANHLSRRAFPVISSHPALAGLDAQAFRDWAGESSLVPPIDAANDQINTAPHGWRWGARHVVSSAPIEIPHRAGWRPILACEFDGAYTPLAEIPIARGVLTLCTLDLEDHASADPAAERVARAVFSAAASAKPEARQSAIYLGGDAGISLLHASGITGKRGTALPENGVVIIGPDYKVTDAALDAFLRRGGRALILPRAATDAPLGVQLSMILRHPGSIDVPAWPSCRGIWPGELRRRVDAPAWTITSGADAIGADGLLAEVRRGSGVAVYFQLDATELEADRQHYNRYTRWRWTRALTQIASNLGILCLGDFQILRPAQEPLYHPDFLTDFPQGDDPYRYYRW